MVLKLPINIIEEFILQDKLEGIHILTKSTETILCIYNTYICLINLNHIPLLVEKKNLNTKFLYQRGWINMILRHYLSHHSDFNDENKWRYIKNRFC